MEIEDSYMTEEESIRNSNDCQPFISDAPKKENKNPQKNKLYSEQRLINDLKEIQNNTNNNIITNNNVYKIFDYVITKNNEINMDIEYINFFILTFIFPKDYPFSPPKIIFKSGNRIDKIFDNKGNFVLEKIEKYNWTPAISLSSIISSIEYIIKDNKDNNHTNDNNNKSCCNFCGLKKKYGKRKWKDYYGANFVRNIKKFKEG